jgi:hypothetical protein
MLSFGRALDWIFEVQESSAVAEVGSFLSYDDGCIVRLMIDGQYHRILTGMEWARRLTEMQFDLSDEARFILSKNSVVLPKGQMTLGVVRGKTSTREVESVVRDVGLRDAPLAVACVLRELMFNHQFDDMGIDSLIVRHAPALDSSGDYCRLRVLMGNQGSPGSLDVYYGHPVGEAEKGMGFVHIL